MEEKPKENSLMKYMANPKSFTLKKWFAELLKGKFPPHENVIERVSMALVTEKDLADFGKLVAEVYESGYIKAVNDYREQFEKMGVKISIVAEPTKSQG